MTQETTSAPVYTVRFEGDEGQVHAHVDGELVGMLRWDYVHAEPPVVLDLSVEEEHRKKGIARRMFEVARAHESQLVHSDVLTPQGREFVAALRREGSLSGR